jgi:hypothetical protein
MLPNEHLVWCEKFDAAYLAKERSMKQKPARSKSGSENLNNIRPAKGLIKND